MTSDSMLVCSRSYVIGWVEKVVQTANSTSGSQSAVLREFEGAAVGWMMIVAGGDKNGLFFYLF